MIFNISCISNYLCLKFIFIYLTIYLDKAKITLDFILLDSRQAFQFWAYFWKQWACYCERFPRANWKILKHSKATWCVSNRRSTLAAGPHYFFSLCIFSNNNKNYNNNKKKTHPRQILVSAQKQITQTWKDCCLCDCCNSPKSSHQYNCCTWLINISEAWQTLDDFLLSWSKDIV